MRKIQKLLGKFNAISERLELDGIVDYLVNRLQDESEKDGIKFLTREYKMKSDEAKMLISKYLSEFRKVPIPRTKDVERLVKSVLKGKS